MTTSSTGSGLDWNEERTATVRKLWLEGLSASQVAKQLGGVTRNAVIGKVHRMGLARAAPSRPSKPSFKAPRPSSVSTAPRRVPAAPRAVAAPSVAPVRPFPSLVDLSGTADTLSLGRNMCRWPIGDPSSAAFSFCGRYSEKSYCSDHARVAFAAPTPKKDKPKRSHFDYRRQFHA